MQVGLETILFGPRIDDIEAALDVIVEAGYQGVEFSQSPSMLRVKPQQPGGKSQPVTIEQLKGFLQARGLKFLGMAGGTLDERMAFCEGASPYSPICWRPEYLYVEDVDDKVLLETANRQFLLALHAHAFMKNHRLEDAARLLEAYPALRWLPDTAHLYIVGDDPVHGIFNYLSRLAAIHLKDWRRAYGRSYHRYARGFTELGNGDLRTILEEVIVRLRKVGYGGWIIVEQDYTDSTPRQSALLNAFWLRSKSVPIMPKEIPQQTPISVNDPFSNRAHNPSYRAQWAFVQALQQAGLTELPLCYQLIADAVKKLCDCFFVSIWSCNPVRDEMNLLAASPSLSSLSSELSSPVETVLKAKTPLLGIALERREVTPFDLSDPHPGAIYGSPHAEFQWANILNHFSATRLIGLPVLNRYNPHHVRFLVGLLPRNRDIPVDLEDAFWQNNPFGWGADLARTADTSLDDLCALAVARTNLLAGEYRDIPSFANALAKHVKKEIQCEGTSIFLVNVTGNRLECVGSTGITWDDAVGPRFYTLGEGVTGEAWKQNETMSFRDILRERTGHKPKSRETGPDVDANRDNVLFVPLVNYKGVVKGVVRCRNKRPPFVNQKVGEETIFTHDDAALVDAIGHAAMPHFDILQSFVQRSRAVARLTHELSLPLIAVRGCMDLIQEELREYNTDYQSIFSNDYMEDIWSWTELMLGLQGNAELYGLTSEHIPLRITKVLLWGEVIVPAVRQVDILLKERGFSPKRIIPAPIYDIPALYIDKNRFQQVFFNLLSNAIKYSLDDPTLFNVEIGGRKQAGYYEVYIRDTGPGILPEYGLSIFDEGVRGREAINRYVAGQGLGLWVVRRILEAHGGFVRVTNYYNPTEITLYLPTSLAMHPPSQKLS